MTTVMGLRQLGHDVTHLSEEGLIRMADQDIVAKAIAESRIVLTFDLDFAGIMALSKLASPSVVLFRLRNQTPLSVWPRLVQVFRECGVRLDQGAFITVEESGYRLRRLPFR